MEARPVNIYYQGGDRLRVFWHSTETQRAITALETWIVVHSHTHTAVNSDSPQHDADSVTTQQEGGHHAQE